MAENAEAATRREQFSTLTTGRRNAMTTASAAGDRRASRSVDLNRESAGRQPLVDVAPRSQTAKHRRPLLPLANCASLLGVTGHRIAVHEARSITRLCA